MDLAFRLGTALLAVVLVGIAVWNGEGAEYGYVNHDAANSLYVGGKILHGDVLYTDWYYFVLPPVVILSAGACFVAEGLGLAPQTVLHLFVIAAAGLGAWVIRRSGFGGRDGGRVIVLAYLGILVLLGTTPGDFAQREHLFALLFVPYFVWRLSGSPASPSLLVLCFGLGFAAMIKPHFLLGLALSEALFLSERRSRAAVWASSTAGAITPFALLALQPPALEALFTKALPYHLSRNDSPYDADLARLLLEPTQLAPLIIGVLFLACTAWAVARGVVGGRTAAAPLGIALAFYLAVWHQGKFFPYHYLPFEAMAWVFLWFLAHRIALQLPSQRWRRLAASAVWAIPSLAIARGVVELGALVTREPPAVIRALDQALERPGRILLVTPSVEGAFFTRALRGQLEILGPWTSNYTVPALLAIEDPARREREIRDYFAPLAARIGEQQPDAVLFSPRRQALSGVTLHDVFVDEYRLFPIPGYERSEPMPGGWILYRRR